MLISLSQAPPPSVLTGILFMRILFTCVTQLDLRVTAAASTSDQTSFHFNRYTRVTIRHTHEPALCETEAEGLSDKVITDGC